MMMMMMMMIIIINIIIIYIANKLGASKTDSCKKNYTY